MPSVLVSQSVVFLAPQLNPQLFSESWLVSNGVVRANAITGDRITTAMMSVVGTNDIQIIALTDKIQIQTKRRGVPHDAVIQAATRLLDGAGDLPWSAVGINCDWESIPTCDDLAAFSRRKFSRDGMFSDVVNANAATFGAFLIRPAVGGGALALQVKPVFADLNLTQLSDRFSSHFNYHYALVGNNCKQEAVSVLEFAPAIHDESRSIADAIWAQEAD